MSQHTELGNDQKADSDTSKNVWEFDPDRQYQINEAARIYGLFRGNATPERVVKKNLFRNRNSVNGRELAEFFDKCGIPCRSRHESISLDQLSETAPEYDKVCTLESYNDFIVETNDDLASEVVPFFAFAHLTSGQRKAINDFVEAEIEDFRSATGEDELAYVPHAKTLALDCDFMAKDMDYFYDTLFADIHRGDDGKVALPRKIAVTFDKASAPIRIDPRLRNPSHTKFKEERRYGRIEINGYHSNVDTKKHSVCYYYYLPLQDLLDTLKTK